MVLQNHATDEYARVANEQLLAEGYDVYGRFFEKPKYQVRWKHEGELEPVHKRPSDRDDCSFLQERLSFCVGPGSTVEICRNASEAPSAGECSPGHFQVCHLNVSDALSLCLVFSSP